ncbi:hypothetical protein JNM87_01540 [Candidatus Saccharibacteria bacterium]|nr:hypothetical protein [Candidatus Saccharibacteria bacterium]
MKYRKLYKIFLKSVVIATLFLGMKYWFHAKSWEILESSSLHNSVVSSAIFVMGFVMTVTLRDYKESERIPAEFASTVENLYEDAREIHRTYPSFDLSGFRNNLLRILQLFRAGTREKRKGTRREISELNQTFGEMEKAGVPPNFVVKLKQQQAQLSRCIYRVNYIQKIRFIPSAFVLVSSIAIIVSLTLLLTNIEPFMGSLILTGIIVYVLAYMVQLIQVISTPFHASGATYDDVSLFLIDETREYIEARAISEIKSHTTKKKK